MMPPGFLGENAQQTTLSGERRVYLNHTMQVTTHPCRKIIIITLFRGERDVQQDHMTGYELIERGF